MRKFLKIAGITLASVLGVVVVAAAVLVYVVFTPARLTPVVKQVASQYVRCDYELGQVDLTFFSTFPEFGLRVDSVCIVNPVEGAQSDTLLAASKLVARLDIVKLLKEGDVCVSEVALQDVVLNAYMGVDTTNFDILALEADTTAKDTTSAPFIKSISVDDMSVQLYGRVISLVDEKDSLSVRLHEPTVRFSSKEVGELLKGNLEVAFPELSASYKGVDYAANATVSVELPYELKIDMQSLDSIRSLSVDLLKAKVAVNQFEVKLDGRADVLPAIDVDLQLETNKIRLSELLALVPTSLFSMSEGIEADADLQLQAHVTGLYTDSVMPLVDGSLQLENASGSMASLPYQLNNVAGEADFHVDLSGREASYAVLNKLHAETKKSQCDISGRVDDLLGKMLLDLLLDIDLNIPDAQYFLPENILAKGKAKGQLAAKIALDDLTEVQLQKGIIHMDMALDKFEAQYDSMLINAHQGRLVANIPNTQKVDAHAGRQAAARRKNVNFLDGTLAVSGLTVEENGFLAANLQKTDIRVQVSNILSDNPVMCADVQLTTSDLAASMELRDSLDQATTAVVHTQQPTVHAYVEYDTEDAEGIPTLACDFKMNSLAVEYDTIQAQLAATEGSASISGGRRDKTQPRLKATLKAQNVAAKMGLMAEATMGKLALTAAAQHTANEENILLAWRPRLNFDLENAVAKLDAIEPEIRIPACKFSYSNKDFHIDTAKVQLANSDFSLSGDVKNIGPWLEKKGMLTGVLNFRSAYTDVDQMLAFVSGMGSEENESSAANASSSATAHASSEKNSSEQADSDAFVFVVPKGVDLTLNTHIGHASAFEQDLRDLGGMVYIRDGVMVIEEMGFVCEAARLQLTALYKTPRRNHIFVGFDYHMTQINVEELISMIPQVDSMLPMLRSFKGLANFHLAGETYLNDRYELKQSTTRGAMSIDAKDLTLLDGEVFSKIAKLLTFKKKTENKIDSISAEVALYKGEIDIYPFVVTCDKWMGAVGGTHNLDGTMNYNINLLNPIYLGVNVQGNLNTFEKLTDLDIKLAKCVYAKDFKPVLRRQVDTQSADIRKMIKAALESNIKQ